MKLYFTLSFILGFLSIQAQKKYAEAPIHFNLYHVNPYNNLALKGAQGNEFSLLARQNFGNFGNISTQYFTGFINLPQKGKSQNTLGLIVYNDKEGDYLRTNRFYGAFSRHQSISKKWKLSLGISAGAYMFRVKFNNVTGGFSETTIDGSASIGLSSKNTKICVSLNQALNSKPSQFNNDLFLGRFIVLNGIHAISLNEKVKLKFGGYYKPIKQNSNDIFTLGLSTKIMHKKIGAGTVWDVNNGFSILVSLNQLSIVNKNTINFEIAYYTPFTKNVRQRINVLEVSLNYLLQKNK